MSIAAEPELISAVIPARNAASTLAETLDSLLAQTEPRWHAVLVDDGSTDATRAIMDDYAARDRRFTVLTGPSAGVSRARNTGLPLARGRWLHFIDSDDLVAPEFYAKMLAKLMEVPDAVAGYCGYRRLMADGSLTWMLFLPDIAEDPMEAFARLCGLHTSGLLLDREAVKKVGGYDPSLKTCEDWDLFQRVARLPGSWVPLREPLAFYRTSAASLSRNLTQIEHDARLVIARGYRADERLTGLVLAHPDGADDPGDAVETGYAKVVFWTAAQRCSIGAAEMPFEPAFRNLRKFTADYPFLVEVVIEGQMLGERVTADKLAALWPRYAEGATRLIKQLGAAWDDPAAAHAMHLHFEEKILDHDNLAAPRQLGFTLGLRIDIENPPDTELPPGIERVYAYLMDGDRIAAVAKFSATGRISRRRWAELILESIDPHAYYNILRRRHRVRLAGYRFAHQAATILRRPQLLWQRQELQRRRPDFQRAALLSLT